MSCTYTTALSSFPTTRAEACTLKNSGSLNCRRASSIQSLVSCRPPARFPVPVLVLSLGCFDEIGTSSNYFPYGLSGNHALARCTCPSDPLLAASCERTTVDQNLRVPGGPTIMCHHLACQYQNGSVPTRRRRAASQISWQLRHLDVHP